MGQGREITASSSSRNERPHRQADVLRPLGFQQQCDFPSSRHLARSLTMRVTAKEPPLISAMRELYSERDNRVACACRLFCAGLHRSIRHHCWHLAIYERVRSRQPGSPDNNHRFRSENTSMARCRACASVRHRRSLPPGPASSRFVPPAPWTFP